MTRLLAGIDRLLVFLAGLALAVAGAVPAALYWDIPYVSDALGAVNRGAAASFAQSPWFPVALIGVFLVCLVAGVWLIAANLRTRSFAERGTAPADPELGDTVINLQRLSQAASEHMALSDLVERAAATVSMIRDRPTVTFTVTANPACDLAETVNFVEAADRDFTEACGAMDIDTVYKLHLDRIDD
ncbi:hypothetical protein SAMN04488535_1890 [Corynebacterium mycetoides]|uniref:Alkaline shock response membrane anchor protein AmaP n=1 Tax=Corynebacterium mycetoides TaxID=38302 RepID=A0A1G9QEE1_9CORY|nr:hypothetical protein [Corynebacterium mycetoides]SDM09379.1 hypothetical protein SAMN04488535_1890 [Corynebacterium mycetoides]